MPLLNFEEKDYFMTKDCRGNSNIIYKALGASNHCESEREENDFYATEPKAIELLLEKETFNNTVWECACGEGHLSEVLKKNGYNVISSDLIDRGYGKGGIDFLKHEFKPYNGDIITNPPYKYATEFVYKALEILQENRKMAMFLKIQFLEGKERRKLFEKYPPKKIYVSSSRLKCAKNADFNIRTGAMCYAWFVWEKGYKGLTTSDWRN